MPLLVYIDFKNEHHCRCYEKHLIRLGRTYFKRNYNGLVDMDSDSGRFVDPRLYISLRDKTFTNYPNITETYISQI